MTIHDQMRALVKAHYDGDDARFRQTVIQIAARDKNPDRARQLKLLTERMVELPMDTRPFVSATKPCQFSDLILSDRVTTTLETVALELDNALALELRGIRPRRRLLFHGPPGNGKTSAAAALASRIGRTVYVASLPAIVGSHMGESGARLSKLLGALAAPIVLVLDEIDALGSSRVSSKDAAGREYNTITNTLLTLLDQHDSGVLIATTNRVDILDPALVRRFDDAVEFAAPDSEAKAELAHKLCGRFGVTFTAAHHAADADSFDAVAKHVIALIRERALAEILATKAEAAE